MSNGSVSGQAKPAAATFGVDSREWWRTHRSPGEIAELIDQIVRERKEAERRLSEITRNHDRLQARFDMIGAELALERERFRRELQRVSKNAAAAAPSDGRERIPGPPAIGEGRLKAEMAARERLMDDEVQRRVHEIQVEWKQERHRMRKQMAALEQELQTYRLTTGNY